MMGKAVEYRDFTPMAACPPSAAEASAETMGRQLAIARGQARAEGFAAGAEEAEARFGRDQQALIESLQLELKNLGSELDAIGRRSAHGAAQLVTAFLSALGPTLARVRIADDVAEYVAEIVAEGAQGGLTIEAAPAAIDLISEAMANMDPEVAALCDFQTNEELPPDAARLHWRDGFDEIDADASMRRAVEALQAKILLETASAPDPNGTDANAASEDETPEEKDFCNE